MCLALQLASDPLVTWLSSVGSAVAVPEVRAVQHSGVQLVFWGIALLLPELPLALTVSLEVDNFNKVNTCNPHKHVPFLCNHIALVDFCLPAWTPKPSWASVLVVLAVP